MENIFIILAEGRIYLLLYACLAAAMLIELFYENEIVSRWLARAGMLAVILLIGLRWETGTDWLPYLRVFYTNDTTSDYDAVVFGIDQGYILFNRAIYALSTDYTWFLIVDAFIAMIPIYIFIEKSTKFPVMGVYLFYTSYAITHFMGSNRRMIAIGFVCLGFLYLSRNERLRTRWHRWALPFGVAMFVHRTSLAALPGLLVSRKAWPTWAVIGGLLAALLLGMGGIPFTVLELLARSLADFTGITAVEKLIFYTSGDAQLDAEFDVVRQAILGVAKRSTVLAIFILFMRYGRPSEYAQRLFNIYIVGCAIYFALLGSPIFQVISTYYSIVEIVLIPIIFYNIPSFKIPYTLYLIIVPLFLLLSSLSPYLDLYVPYHSILNY